jgi:hypothetical protein
MARVRYWIAKRTVHAESGRRWEIGAALRAQGDLVGARTLHEQELDVCRRVLGPEHPSTLTSMNNLAETLPEQGDLASDSA